MTENCGCLFELDINKNIKKQLLECGWHQDKLQEVERETYGKVLEMLEEKPGELGWSRQFNERLVKELSHLKSGEKRIINKPFNKEEFIKEKL